MTLRLRPRGLAASSAVSSFVSHIKNFHNGMLILPYSRRRFPSELRRQDTKNRQPIDDIDPFIRQELRSNAETL